jgi:hypothetical protein
MSGKVSSKIVTDSLVLNLDGANPKSYVSGSTIWNDLTYYKNDGVLTNNPTYNSNNGGSIEFDGTNDYVNCGNSNSLKFFDGDSFTICSWVKPNPTMSAGVIVQHGGEPNSATGFALYLAFGYVEFAKSNVANTGQNITTTPFNNNEWNHICCSIKYSGLSGQIKFYVNGILKSTFNGWSANPNISDYTRPLNVGRSETDAFFNNLPFKGNISNVSIYNRILSSQEVLQNYNALKNRFI